MSRTSGVATVQLFESQAKGSRQAALVLLKQAFESAGVEFTDGEQPGVRLSKAGASRLRGRMLKTSTGIGKRHQKRTIGTHSPAGPSGTQIMSGGPSLATSSILSTS